MDERHVGLQISGDQVTGIEENETEEELKPYQIADGLAELFEGCEIGKMIDGVTFFLAKAMNDSSGSLKEEHEDFVGCQIEYIVKKLTHYARHIEKEYKKRGE